MKRLLVLLMLAACAEAAPPPSPMRSSGAEAGAGAVTERDRQARFACDARGRMASATPAFGGPGMGGLTGGMLSQQSAGEAVARRCWEGYRATGVLPRS